MENPEFQKMKAFRVTDILDYLAHSVVIRSILNKNTGSVSAISFAAGEVLVGKISPYDVFIQVIDGNAEIIIEDKSNLLETGQSIIIPAHNRNIIKANVKFKMLSTVIKSGYEEVSL